MERSHAKKAFCLLLAAVSCLFVGQAFAKSYYPNGFFLTLGSVGSEMVISSISLRPKNSVKLKRDSLNDHGVGVEAEIGYHFKSAPLTLDLEVTKRPNMNDDVADDIQDPTVATSENLVTKVENMTAMVNLFYDINLGNDYFVPFVIGGIGVSKTKGRVKATIQLSPTTVSASKTLQSFAWQAGAGLRIKLTANFFVSAYYKYVQLGKVQWGPWKNPNSTYATRTLKSSDFSSNEAIISLTYFFGDQTQLKSPSLIGD